MRYTNPLVIIYALLLAFTSLVCEGQVSGKKTGKVAAEVVTKLPKATGPFTQASVGCALQDRAGNLWFGTNGEGLFRYNGKTFTRFTEQHGLDSRIVYALFQDRAGIIWIGTKTGLCRYDGTSFIKTDLIQGPNPTGRIPQAVNGVWAIMQDKRGTIWLGTDDGVYCYNAPLGGAAGSFSCFSDSGISNPDNLHLKSIFSFLEDRHGNIWMTSCIGEGLIRFDGKTVMRVSPKGYARTQYLIEDKSGAIWFGSMGKGICRYNGKTIETNVFGEKNMSGFLYLMLQDHGGNLWFSGPYANRQLCCYNGKELIDFSSRYNRSEKDLYPVYTDASGAIWLAGQYMRLYRFDPASGNFTCLSE